MSVNKYLLKLREVWDQVWDEEAPNEDDELGFLHVLSTDLFQKLPGKVVYSEHEAVENYHKGESTIHINYWIAYNDSLVNLYYDDEGDYDDLVELTSWHDFLEKFTITQHELNPNVVTYALKNNRQCTWECVCKLAKHVGLSEIRI